MAKTKGSDIHYVSLEQVIARYSLHLSTDTEVLRATKEHLKDLYQNGRITKENYGLQIDQAERIGKLLEDMQRCIVANDPAPKLDFDD